MSTRLAVAPSGSSWAREVSEQSGLLLSADEADHLPARHGLPRDDGELGDGAASDAP